MQKTYQQNFSLYLIAALTSAFLSIWMTATRPVINPDAICYLMSAEAIGNLGISGMMHLCGQAAWPFYSVIIYLFNHLTHISYATSAYLIDGFFTIISVITFIAIVKKLGGKTSVLWLAGVVILLSHTFNSVREYIIRDHGFWAFYLISVFFLLRYFQKTNWYDAIFWNISLFIATLFRVEGLILLIGLPFSIWFCPDLSLRKKLSGFLSLNFLSIVGCCIIGFWFILHPQQLQNKLGRMTELTQQFQYGYLLMANQFVHIKAVLLQYVFSDLSKKDANIVIICLMIIWYLLNVITILSWIYAALVGYAWISKKVLFPKRMQLVLIAYIILNFLITFVFFSEALFLAKRYLVALSLILMLWVPFVLNILIDQYRSRKNRFLLILVFFCTLYSAAGGLFEFGPSKNYLRNAGDWLATSIAKDKTLYSNDIEVMYYSKHFGNSIFQKAHSYRNLDVIADGKWRQYNYLALRLSAHENAQTLLRFNLNPVKIFTNNRGDQVAIFKVNDS